MAVSLSSILKNSELSLKQFTEKYKAELEKSIEYKDIGEGVKPYAKCILRGKDIFMKPEEVVRQLFARKLIEEYGYPKDNISFEKPVKSVGRTKSDTDFADIVVFTDSSKEKAYIIFEIKRPEEKNIEEQKKQLESYCLVEGASIGALINGDDIEQFYVNNIDKETKTHTLKDIPKLPKYGETLDDILNARFTFKSLILNDRLRNETLKKIIKDLEQRFSANDSSDKSFDEILKLIYCKLFDEFNHSDDADFVSRNVKRRLKKDNGITYYEALEEIADDDFSLMEFRAKHSEDEKVVFDRISALFKNAQNHWKGAFAPNTVLNMQPSTVKSCVLEFQNVKLFNSNLEVVDEAFEYLVNKNQKGEMGQYFTPRYVIDMCVRMLNPKKEETMIDTASGSCGFPMHTILHVWDKFDNLTAKRQPWETDYVRDKVFAIDFSEKAVRVGKILNIITGDGHSNVLYLDTLNYTRWESQFKNDTGWWAKYNEGFTRLENLCADGKKYSHFNFDILMANPPFAGDLDDKKILGQYELSKNSKGQIQNKVGRDILFIERNLNFLKPGGRMAIVLPQGRFNNSSDKYIRDYIADKARILAVVGLHGNTFKPHTGTKTSVLFIQKWTDKDGINPKKDDYNIFFATMQEPSKDNSGDKIYVTEHYYEVKKFTYKTSEKYYLGTEELSKDEYDAAVTDDKKKKQCKIKIIPTVLTASTNYREDEFEEKFGTKDAESQKTWIQKAVQFVLKPVKKDKKQEENLKSHISVDEYLALQEETKQKYKEVPQLGTNVNDPIDNGTYTTLSALAKKFYLPETDVSERTERVKDTHGHIFVRHDLFNHDPDLKPQGRYCKDGIAEAFAEFAKKEGLSFF